MTYLTERQEQGGCGMRTSNGAGPQMYQGHTITIRVGDAALESMGEAHLGALCAEYTVEPPAPPAPPRPNRKQRRAEAAKRRMARR